FLRDMVLGAPPAAPVAQTRDSGPVLEAVSDDSALLLPQPIVDIQSEIATFSDFTDSEALETPEGRRELAQRIALLADVDDEQAEESAGIVEQNIIGEQSIIAPDGVEIEAEAVEIEIRTAEVSRRRKQGLDAKTPVDNILREGVKNNSAVEIVAQASDDAAGADVAAGTVAVQGTAAVESNASTAEEVKVTPSLSGIDRQRMLGEAGKLYISGAYAEAEAAYRNILAKNSTNVDALRGLALVAVATGRYQLAVATYLKILEYYPNDPVAIADLANLHGVSGKNFYAIEEALKRVLGKRPEWDGRLHFALGNLYADNQRWLDAQQSYFDAYANEQENPDYAYNLAVMLDYLNKPLLAVNYYRQALDLAKRMPSGFNAAQVESRIKSISK
ncbi:MAG: tetratricopeptide repeat protein, partial [Betaproteobacteria bacterium]|nr:tetratricopeptide repeat protein [Betaproteobacteria bacterium]